MELRRLGWKQHVEGALTFWYQAEKSVSFLTPITICTEPSIFASSSFPTGLPEPSILRATKLTSSTLNCSVLRLLRYPTTFCPDKNAVELEESAWRANMSDDNTMEASITVTTLENVSLLNAKRETAIDGAGDIEAHRSENPREFLSSPKNSVRRSSEARRSSLILVFFLPRAEELVSVSSRAMTTTGSVVAILAVSLFGL